MIICLAGFSGSGKSTLLQNLKRSAMSDWDFKDLDELVRRQLEIAQGASFPALGLAIEQVGFEVFRRTEAEILDQTINLYERQEKSLVLALGGGALGRGLAIIKRSSVAQLVGLDIPFEVCWRRIASDPNRPLSQLGEEKMREKFQRRRVLLLESDLILTQNELAAPLNLQQLLQLLKS